MGRKRKCQNELVAESDREFVLTSAARLFREQGFDHTNVKEISEACNMLPGSLYYRYPSKESLLVDLMRLALEQASTALLKAFQEVTDPAEQIRRAINAHLGLLVGGSDMVYVLLFEWRSLRGAERQEMIDLRDRYEALWDSKLRSLSELGLIRPDIDLSLLRLIGIGALNWTATWFRKDGYYSSEDIGDFVWRIIRDSIINQPLIIKDTNGLS